MKRFIEEADRTQLTLLPESLDDYIGESNPVRAIEAFVAHLDLAELGFEVVPEATGRPGAAHSRVRAAFERRSPARHARHHAATGIASSSG